MVERQEKRILKALKNLEIAALIQRRSHPQLSALTKALWNDNWKKAMETFERLSKFEITHKSSINAFM